MHTNDPTQISNSPFQPAGQSKPESSSAAYTPSLPKNSMNQANPLVPSTHSSSLTNARENTSASVRDFAGISAKEYAAVSAKEPAQIQPRDYAPIPQQNPINPSVKDNFPITSTGKDNSSTISHDSSATLAAKEKKSTAVPWKTSSSPNSKSPTPASNLFTTQSVPLVHDDSTAELERAKSTERMNLTGGVFYPNIGESITYRGKACKGVRGLINRIFHTHIEPSPRSKEAKLQDMINHIRGDLPRNGFNIAFVAGKNSAGKSTLALATAQIFAQHRQNMVVSVIDAAPDAMSSVPYRIRSNRKRKLHELAAEEWPVSPSQLSDYVNTTPEGVAVVLQDTHYPLTSDMYISLRRAIGAASPITITDCASPYTSRLLHAVVQNADAIVLVAANRHDSAQLSSDAFEQIRKLNPAAPIFVALNCVKKKPEAEKKKERINYMAVFNDMVGKTDRVISIPFDEYLDKGGLIEFNQLNKNTQHQLTVLADRISQIFAKGNA